MSAQDTAIPPLESQPDPAHEPPGTQIHTANDTLAALAPVSAAERIAALDAVRGFALLGILAMNVLTFSYMLSATFNPTVQGGATGVNLWTYIVMAVLVDGRCVRCSR